MKIRHKMEENISEKNQHIGENSSICYEMINMMYCRELDFTDENGRKFDVPHEGSLGLLAMGHIGLIEWRKSRKKYMQERAKTAKEKTEE